MRSVRRSLAAAVAAGLLLAAAGCANDTAGPGGDGAAGRLSIGLLVSLSGTYQSVGTDMRNGFELYLKTHDNKLGGHPIDLKVADEGDGADKLVDFLVGQKIV